MNSAYSRTFASGKFLEEGTDDRLRVVSFGAKTLGTESVSLKLYSAHAVYTVALPRVKVQTPFASPDTAYRSSAIVLLNLAPEPVLGATIFSDPNCPPEDVVLESAAALNDPKRVLPKGEAGVLRRLAHEAGDGSHAVLLKLSEIPPPDYPADARERGATGIARIIVAVDDRGNATGFRIWDSSGDSTLDLASLDAARRSTYAPAVCACHPVGAGVPFVPVFQAE